MDSDLYANLILSTKMGCISVQLPAVLFLGSHMSRHRIYTQTAKVKLTCSVCFLPISLSIFNWFSLNFPRTICESLAKYSYIFIIKYPTVQKLYHLSHSTVISNSNYQVWVIAANLDHGHQLLVLSPVNKDYMMVVQVFIYF